MQDLLTGLSQPIRLSTGEEVSVGVSIGVACQPTHAAEATQLVRAADEALYHVKRNGKQAFALALPE
jgi:diguanylate cyclase (GGDEF)-like protein